MPARRPANAPRARGLDALRRAGAVSNLLFLYALTTREVGQLRDVAGVLGLSVQAASHTYRGLARRGLVEVRSGRYRPTVRGVDFLHGTLQALESDLAERLERMHIVASTKALARTPIAAGDAVGLSMEDGILTARARPRGPARGVARSRARPGELVEVERLQGIVPLRPAHVELLTVAEATANAPATVRALARELARRPTALVAVYGLEAYLLARCADPARPVQRFGVPGAVEDASRLGVPSTIVVLERDAPQLLAEFGGLGTFRIALAPLDGRNPRGGRRST